MGNLDFMGRIAEGKIQEAMEEGKFDNLPGKGKPIVFDDDPMTPPHLRMVNRILRNANVLPEWMQIFRDIETERKQLLELHRKVIRENGKWAARLARQPQMPGVAHQYSLWHAKARSDYLKLLKSINSSILKFTLVAPSTAQPMASHKIDAEMAVFDADVLSHLSYEHRSESGDTSESTVREATRAKYQGGDPHGRA